MEVSKIQKENSLTVAVKGRIDTSTAPTLEEELKNSLDGIEKLTFDFTGVEYISSAGLRVMLATQKIMNRQGEMEIIGVNDTVMEIFDVTGFSDIIKIN